MSTTEQTSATNTNASTWIIRLNWVDLITLSGILTSGLAITSALHGDYFLTCGWLFIAMLGDALDGWLARRWQLTREFGRYLDSFMDVLIYLVAPALTWYLWGMQSLFVIPLIALIACGAIRLSVFNQIGNVSAESGALGYLGMPVFWSPFILLGSLLLTQALPLVWVKILSTLALMAFALCMLWRRAFFKFSSLWQMISITLIAASASFLLHGYL
jgi:CDP-diacylglycerol--serine O-phosphatidyltransferase